MIQNRITMCYIATVVEIYGSDRHIEGVGIRFVLLKFFQLSQIPESSEEIQIKASEMSV